ncbi:MAG TPA: hypothetical protein VJ836_07495 [Candidatus Saccharimonadales bacterium]|nr:hypothetical protein [Candidatus Saccharimonadales bacterium]
MSEKSRRTGTRLSKGLRIGLLCLATLAGDTITTDHIAALEQQREKAVAAPVYPHRCFNAPLPVRKPKQTQPQPLRLTADSRGVFTQDTLNTVALADKAIGAMVRVEYLAPSPDNPKVTQLVRASGFLTSDPQGKQIALVAAHTVAQPNWAAIVMSDNYGTRAHITGGCYIYERDGVFGDLGTYPPAKQGEKPLLQTIDLAILRISRHLGKTSLALSSESPKRGDWAFFANYQNGEQHSYNGVVVATPSPYNIYLTGVEPSRKPELSAYTIQHGASGGVVLSPRLTVEGMSFAGSPSTPAIWQAAQKHNNVVANIPAGPDSGYVPTPAWVLDRDYIKTAIEQGNY